MPAEMIKMFKNAGKNDDSKYHRATTPGGSAGPLRQRRGSLIANMCGTFLFDRRNYVAVQFG